MSQEAKDDNATAIPAFIIQRPEGVFIDLVKYRFAEHALAEVEKFFASGYYLAELDYPLFIDVFYHFTADKLSDEINGQIKAGKQPMLKIASKLEAFAPERRALCKSVKIAEGKAKVDFEAATPAVEGSGAPAPLSVDEFIADLWVKGVRYGIDVGLVKDRLLSGKGGAEVVASASTPTPGKPACVEELMQDLHRNDAPMELADGRVNLTHFKNHFPHVKKGTRLIKKIPATEGFPGRDVEGRPILPPESKDLNLAALSDQGTVVQLDNDGEFVVANEDGFLNIDPKTKKITVSQKIINRTGVSAHTTGDLCLECEEYEEYGEVQEKRIVEAKNITIHADVFGKVISNGGTIHLKKKLSGDCAINRAGDIVVEGLVTNAEVRACKGSVTIKRAENSLIIGKNVTVLQAVKCDILGEQVEVKSSEGSAIAGRKLKVDKAQAHQGRQSIISVLIPDVFDFEQKIGAITQDIAELGSVIDEKAQEEAKLMKDPRVEKYLTVAAKIKKNELSLSAEQKVSWKKFVAQVTPMIHELSAINGELKKLRAKKEPLDEKIASLEKHKSEASVGISCELGSTGDETLVRTMNIKIDEDPMNEMEAKEMREWLQVFSEEEERLLLGKSGAFSWKYDG